VAALRSEQRRRGADAATAAGDEKDAAQDVSKRSVDVGCRVRLQQLQGCLHTKFDASSVLPEPL
jgi:hypothetical protein